MHAIRKDTSMSISVTTDHHRQLGLFAFALLITCAVLPYVGTLGNDFVFDDTVQVLKNPYIQTTHYLPQMFTGTVWSYVSTGARTNYYRPMMTLGYLVSFKLFG